jgi:uncharacterized LabA/DUF88 family protein
VGTVENPDTREKVAVFVDGANLYHSIKSYYKGVLDYGVLLATAVGDRKLLRATFYIVEKQEPDETSGSVRPFVYNLNKFGYKVRSKPLIIRETLSPEGERTMFHKGDWDMGIVVDMMRLAESEKGLRIEVISAAQCTSQALLDVCDTHTDLGDIPDLFRRPVPPKAVDDQQSAIR